MPKPMRWKCGARQCLAALALWHLSAAAWALTLSPNPLILTVLGNQATLTVSIPEAQASEVTVSLSVAPTHAVLVSPSVTIPAFQTMVTTTVTALVDAGNASITGILGGDSATTDVIIGTADACSVASTAAVAAANNYIIKVQAVEPACRVQGKACNKAITEANNSLKAQAASNKAVVAACKE